MSPHLERVAIGIGGAAAIVVVVGWLHSTVYQDLVELARGGPEFSLAWRIDLVHLVEIAGVVGIAILGLWSRSLAVGAAYAVVGAYLAFLQAITVNFAIGVNLTPPILPEPLAAATWGLWNSAASAVLIDTGAALLVTGLALLVLVGRERLANRQDGAGRSRGWPTSNEVELMRDRLADAVGDDEGPIKRKPRWGWEIFFPD